MGKGENVGYVRVSTAEQNTARQDVLMEELGVDKVFTDKMSGKDTDRPKLRQMMEYVREGDTVIVESISRLARNTKDLLELIEQLNSKGVAFVSRKEQIDTTSSTGKFMLAVIGAMAQLERENILTRQAEGIAIAKAEGRMNGRPKKAVDTFGEMYINVKNGRLSATEGAKLLGITRTTWYRRKKEYESSIDLDF
ncbi:MAG: recombinase family protein [Hydrogenoanaerobacterium sp.]